MFPYRLPALAGTVLMLAACGGPEPAYHLLPAPAAGPVGAGSAATSVAVREIDLPTYAQSIEIAVLDEAGTVRLTEDMRWADDPRRGLTRHFVAALDRALAAQVAAEPWPGADRPDLRVEIMVDRLIAALDGPLSFEGQVLIASSFSGRVVTSERFAYRVSPEAEGFAGLSEAHARAMELLAADVARAIAGVPAAAI